MVDIDIKSKKVHALILYSAFSIFLISLIISVIDGLLVCIHLYAIYAIRQLRAYSFYIHLRIVYYYFPEVALNLLNMIHILDVLVMANNVITRSEYHFLLTHAGGSLRIS